MLSDWYLRLRSLLRRDAVERELDEELRFHLEMQVAALVKEGLPEEEALRRARLEFGGVEQVKEEHRDARGVGFATEIGRDLRYAARQLRRAPAFSLLAVLCLGLGIGVNTAIFGMINSVLLRPLPVEDPEAVVMLRRGEGAGFSYPVFRELESADRTLSGVAASLPMESDLEVDGTSRFVTAEVVSRDYGEVLGVRTVLGRWFADDAEPAAVISHAAWQRYFNLAPDVVGRRVRSESQIYTIVGVAPREFVGVFAPLRTDVWVPIRTRPALAARLEQGDGRSSLMLFGRLRPGATAASATAELNAIDAGLLPHPDAAEPRAAIAADPVRGIPNPANRRAARMVTTLLAAVVGVVLLIASVNVGNLLLVRGAVRQRELAVRRSLGASRARLMRQLLTESLVLAAAGGACGLLMAFWANRLLERTLPSVVQAFALDLDLSLDGRAVLFALAVSLVTTVLCGLAPAWRGSAIPGSLALRNEVGDARGRRRPVGLVAQVVMSLVLLFVAGSFLQALRRMQGADPGFAVEGRLYAHVFLPSPPFTPESGRDFYAQAVDRLAALPGVREASLASTLPLMPGGSECVSPAGGTRVRASTAAVGPGYFRTMAIGLVAGRDFGAEDVPRGSGTVLVNESLARRIRPDGRAVGERVMVGCDSASAAVVVGVVRNSAVRTVGEGDQPHLYRPFARQYAGGLTSIVVRTDGDPAALAEPVRRSLLGMGRGIRVYAVQPLATHVDQSYAQLRWQAAVMTLLGGLALLLAAVGLYGVLAYRVTLRTRELGVRMALGATRRDVFKDVLGRGLAIVLVGVAIGELITAAVTRVLGSVLEGVAATALGTHVAIALVWIAVALVACYLPALRASRMDPLAALRYE